MLNERKARIAKQQEDDTARKEEAAQAAKEAQWSEAEARRNQQHTKRMGRLAELDQKFKIEDEHRYAVMTLKGHEGWVTGLAFSGERLVTCSTDKTVRVWDVDKQRVKKTMTGHTSRINAIAADNRNILSGSQDGNINVWDVRTGEISDTEPTEDGVAISSLSLGTVPKHAMIGRADGEIRLLDLRSPITVVRTFFGHSGPITCLDFNNDMMASSSVDGTAKVWDFGTGTAIHTLKGHFLDVTSVVLCEDKVVTGSMDETIRYWDLASGKCRQKMMFNLGMVSSLALDGPELVAGSLCNRINVYDSTTGEQRYCLGGKDGHEKSVRGVTVKNGQVYSCSNDMTAKVWTLLD